MNDFRGYGCGSLSNCSMKRFFSIRSRRSLPDSPSVFLAISYKSASRFIGRRPAYSRRILWRSSSVGRENSKTVSNLFLIGRIDERQCIGCTDYHNSGLFSSQSNSPSRAVTTSETSRELIGMNEPDNSIKLVNEYDAWRTLACIFEQRTYSSSTIPYMDTNQIGCLNKSILASASFARA